MVDSARARLMAPALSPFLFPCFDFLGETQVVASHWRYLTEVALGGVKIMCGAFVPRL